jgi:hypothetical protein
VSYYDSCAIDEARPTEVERLDTQRVFEPRFDLLIKIGLRHAISTQTKFVTFCIKLHPQERVCKHSFSHDLALGLAMQLSDHAFVHVKLVVIQ